jgi:hypothetical protein
MSPAQLLERARALGIVLTVSGDKLRYEAPSGRMTSELRDALSAHKAAILGLLEAESRSARRIVSREGQLDGRSATHWPLDDWGDLRPCLVCKNLAKGGRCLAATRSEIDGARDYAPPIPRLPRRCYGYAPQAGDPEQTPGRERWPWLAPELSKGRIH